MPTEYRCLICVLQSVNFAGTVFPSHLALHFLFSFFNSWPAPVNHSVRAKTHTWCRSLLKPFLSAVDRLRCLWQDLCCLWRGTSPFVVRTPLNIFHRKNYHTICTLLLACCSLSARQRLFSPSFSLSLFQHTPSHWDWWGARSAWIKMGTFNCVNSHFIFSFSWYLIMELSMVDWIVTNPLSDLPWAFGRVFILMKPPAYSSCKPQRVGLIKNVISATLSIDAPKVMADCTNVKGTLILD